MKRSTNVMLMLLRSSRSLYLITKREPMKKILNVTWVNVASVGSRTFVCAYCGNQVASEKGWDGNTRAAGMPHGALRVCPECSGPTLLAGGDQVPGVSYGNTVKHLPPDIEKLYEESRTAVGAGAPTAAVMSCRKLLMHVAVEKGAKAGDTFQNYVKFLGDNHFVPAGASDWVDKLRTEGNEANHEIVIKTSPEAREIIDFAEMLLKVVYEYPMRGKAAVTRAP
ncbi:DUF4145 domain-containing protein [Candidatus Binatus sp.]|uniref:DUF4145 domain-containing protein n=1 Tax=Candidatus Binatus sp. TaxID=2811406 RepID=UPI003C3432C1